HGGYGQKDQIADFIRSLGHEVIDFGPFSPDPVDYPDYADKVARAVSRGDADRGVLLCGTGLGMAITADKVPGVRAAAIQSIEFAELFREHNDGNVLALSGRFVGLESNQCLVKIFLETEASAEARHRNRVEKIMREDDPAFEGVDA
ncbi:MAG: RpiB/LacA/LacB family sugar-phosphate isomerase, partial [Coriobacteriaceae bacterium]|nr:RpiB/LacA/LacB family sugar-phosphate isomerase [Coriobacteriaceae bacterium]